ncbi:autotransporter outer membrane beta-barrel domain-containing protein [Stenotrophomonas maltophilia]|nr:autotransporter outer membrane beta-barrel domain-containing protein [Stenotrophomonas maltophilia]
MRMMQFTPKFPSAKNQSDLARAIATALLIATSGAAGAATVNPGQTLVVNAGSLPQAYDVNGGTLIVEGATTNRIDTNYSGGQPARVIANGASISSMRLLNSVGTLHNSTVNGQFTLSINVGSGNSGLTRPHLTTAGSTFNGPFTGSGGGRLDSEGSTFAQGIRSLGTILNLKANTKVVGSTYGISLTNSAIAGSAGMQDWGLLLDSSHVAATSGPALLIGGTTTGYPVRVAIQNGSTLSSSNNVVIEGRDSSVFDVTARTSNLNGDITIADTASGTLRFLDGLDLTGRILGPADVIVDQGGRWTLSGDSNTGNLTLGAGSNIFLGAAGTAAYPQLTVNGNYTGNGGTLHFNTVLAGDDAASSRVHVTGDTSGTTQVTVNNIAGAGAQTVNGIPLVQVDGTSNGKFTLQGRAIGGMHEYFLHKGSPGAANGNWYLTSVYTGNPCDINPSLPECTPVDPVDPVDPTDPTDPVPVLRPEPGAYLANQAAAVQMFQLRRHDRGEPGFDRARTGTWVRAGRDQLQANVAGQVDARTHINTLQLGSDVWRWGDGRGQVGVMLGTGEATTQAVSTLSGYGTRGKVKGKSAGVYLGWVQDAQSSAGLYVDGWLQAARFDNEVQGEGIARETYDSRTRSASLEAGYAWAIRSTEASTLYLQPQAQLTWTDYDGDSLVENNGTTVEDGRGGGLNSRLGLRLFGQSTLQGNRVQPFLAANWLRGQRDEAMRFNSESLSAKTPENRYEVQAGAQLQLGQRWSAWGDLRVQRGDSGYRNHGAQVGLRAAW